jgi:hypothetical protein
LAIYGWIVGVSISTFSVGKMKRDHSITFAALLGAVCMLSMVAFPTIARGFAFQVLAQGCAMCYQSAAASGAQGREALRHGILILIFPTLALFVGIFGLIYRRRNVSR